MSLSLRRTAVTLLLVGSLGFAACGGGSDKASDSGSGSGTSAGSAKDSGSAAAATVTLKAATLDPADVSVKVGETVEWKWEGGVQHNLVGDGFKSELQTKGTFDHTFDTAGTFKYKCEVHPTTMIGTVTVA